MVFTCLICGDEMIIVYTNATYLTKNVFKFTHTTTIICYYTNNYHILGRLTKYFAILSIIILNYFIILLA